MIVKNNNDVNLNLQFPAKRDLMLQHWLPAAKRSQLGSFSRKLGAMSEFSVESLLFSCHVYVVIMVPRHFTGKNGPKEGPNIGITIIVVPILRYASTDSPAESVDADNVSLPHSEAGSEVGHHHDGDYCVCDDGHSDDHDHDSGGAHAGNDKLLHGNANR